VSVRRSAVGARPMDARLAHQLAVESKGCRPQPALLSRPPLTTWDTLRAPCKRTRTGKQVRPLGRPKRTGPPP